MKPARLVDPEMVCLCISLACGITQLVVGSWRLLGAQLLLLGVALLLRRRRKRRQPTVMVHVHGNIGPVAEVVKRVGDEIDALGKRGRT